MYFVFNIFVCAEWYHDWAGWVSLLGRIYVVCEAEKVYGVDVGLGRNVAKGLTGKFEGDGVIAFSTVWLHPSRVSNNTRANTLMNFWFIFSAFRLISNLRTPFLENILFTL